MNEQEKQENFDLNAPDQLRQDLRDLYSDAPEVPPEIGDRLMDRARDQLGNRPRILTFRKVAGTLAAAALVLLCVTLLTPVSRRVSRSADTRSDIAVREARAAGDIDNSGRVDVLDALRFARRLESREKVDPRWDFNRDGAVDRRDVDAVAMAAVKLDGRKIQ